MNLDNKIAMLISQARECDAFHAFALDVRLESMGFSARQRDAIIEAVREVRLEVSRSALDG